MDKIDLEDYEIEFKEWMEKNHPKFPKEEIEFNVIKNCWIDDCEYEWVYLWMCAEYLESKKGW